MRAQALSQQAGLDGRKFPRGHREGLTAALARWPPPFESVLNLWKGSASSMLLTVKDLSQATPNQTFHAVRLGCAAKDSLPQDSRLDSI